MEEVAEGNYLPAVARRTDAKRKDVLHLATGRGVSPAASKAIELQGRHIPQWMLKRDKTPRSKSAKDWTHSKRCRK
jgi:hypothetical protein